MDLTTDEAHVLLDTITAWKRSPSPEWDGYDPNPDDPKSSAGGWMATLDSAKGKLTQHLNVPEEAGRWDYSNHLFNARENGIYCRVCGGTSAGVQHS